MHLQMDIAPILNDLVKVFGPALIGYVAFFSKKHLGSLIKSKYARMAVRMAEQVYTDLDGKQKLAKAEDWFINQVKKYGIKVDQQELRGIIEDAYVQFVRDYKNPSKPQLNKAILNWSNGQTTELVQKVIGDVAKSIEQPKQDNQQKDAQQPANPQPQAQDPGVGGS